MKSFVFLCFVALVFGHDLEEEWKKYKATYKKDYESNDDYYKSVFENALKIVDFYNTKHGKGEVGYSCKINKYADLDAENFSDLGGLKRMTAEELEEFLSQMDNTTATQMRGQKPPPFIDWSTKGKLHPIQDQEHCGSCYAFATTGAIESHNAITNADLIKLSEQQVVDCSEDYGNSGCGGGYMTSSYDYFIEEGVGQMRAESYRYTASAGMCQYNKKDERVSLLRYRTLPAQNEDLMRDVVGLIGPVAIGMDASRPGFQFYADGIYEDPKCSKEDINHAMLIVGYGSKNGVDYWIVRNSLGTSWGKNGYGLIRRGVNTCGIANMPSYPVVKKMKKRKQRS